MNPTKEQDKYIQIVFNSQVKDYDLPEKNEFGMSRSVKVTGYWQGLLDVQDLKLYSIGIVENPQILINNVFMSGSYKVSEITNSANSAFAPARQSTLCKPGVYPYFNIAIGKEGVHSYPNLPDEELKRIYKSAMTIKEVVKVMEDANMIGKAAQIMLEYWKDDRDENGELRCLHAFEKALKCKTPKKIQSTMLRKPLEDSYVTFDELLEQGFSDGVFDGLSEMKV